MTTSGIPRGKFGLIYREDWDWVKLDHQMIVYDSGLKKLFPEKSRAEQRKLNGKRLLIDIDKARAAGLLD